MENSIFNIFGNPHSFAPSTTSNTSKSIHGAIGRAPTNLKPSIREPAPSMKALGNARHGGFRAPLKVLSDLGNRGIHSQPSAKEGGVKNTKSLKDSQWKAGPPVKINVTKKPKPDRKVDEMPKSVMEPVLIKENVQATDFYSHPQHDYSSGVGNVLPKHLRLTTEDIDMLGNLTLFRIKPTEFILSELSPVEEDCIDPGSIKYFDIDSSVPPFLAWEDLPLLPQDEEEKAISITVNLI